MAILQVPDTSLRLTDAGEIHRFLEPRGVRYEYRPIEAVSGDIADSSVLQCHEHWLKPFMDRNGYRTADVIRVSPATPNLEAIREKFLREHTHSEDEVRFFVDGEGLFWFHLDVLNEEVFSVRCRTGDLLSVPANTKHWFDLGPFPQVCAIRIFTDETGWVPHYTQSGIEQRYR